MLPGGNGRNKSGIVILKAFANSPLDLRNVGRLDVGFTGQRLHCHFPFDAKASEIPTHQAARIHKRKRPPLRGLKQIVYNQ